MLAPIRNMSPAFSIFVLFVFTITGSVFGQRRITTSVQTGVDFDCPDEFGYYPHPADCTQYYVCVFGGALLESCTGGLMYSHELQTCDWPRNVGCAGAEPIESATASSVTRAEPVSRGRPTSVAAPATPSRSSSSRGISQQQRQQQQQQQRQDELVKQQLYADELGPAEEIESDRQQRVYRGQPSTLGQVARDRDGLGQTRHQVTNAIPASRDKIQYQTQQQPQQPSQQQQAQYRDKTLLGSSRRTKRQVNYRLPGGLQLSMGSQRWPGAHPVISSSPESYADRELSPPPPPSSSNSQILFPKDTQKPYSFFNGDSSLEWSPLRGQQPTAESYLNPASSIRVYNLSIGRQIPRKPVVHYINDQYEHPERYTTRKPYEQLPISSVSTTRRPVIQYHDQFDPSGPPPTPGIKYATSPRPILSTPRPGIKYAQNIPETIPNQPVVHIRPKSQIRNKPSIETQQSYTVKPVKEHIRNDYYSSSTTQPHNNPDIYQQQDVYYVASTQAPPKLEYVENPVKVPSGKNYYSHSISQSKPDSITHKPNHDIVYQREPSENEDNQRPYIDSNQNSQGEQYHYDNHKYVQSTSRPHEKERFHLNQKPVENQNIFIENESHSTPRNPSHTEYNNKPYHSEDDYYDEQIQKYPKQKFSHEQPENINKTYQKNPTVNNPEHYFQSTPKPVKTKNIYSDEEYPQSKPIKSFRGDDPQSPQYVKNQKRPEYFKGSGFKQSSTTDYHDDDDEDYADHEYYEKNNKNNSSDEFKPQFPTAPPDFYHIFNKYANIDNPFASVDFDFDKYLEKLSSGKLSFTTSKPSKSSNIIKKPQRDEVRPETLTAPFFKGSDGNYYPNSNQVPLKPQGFHEQVQQNEDEETEEDEDENEDDDEEGEEEEEDDYEDESSPPSTTTTTVAPPQMKYYIKRRPGQGVTGRPRPGTYTTRPEPTTQPKETLKPDTSMRHDLIVTSGNALNGHDTKASVEVTQSPPQQQQQQQIYIVQQTSPRAPLYNTSRQAANTYDGQQYDLYNLYDEDIELYRDTDYGQYSPSPQPVSNRGRQPIVDVYQQQPATPPPAPQDYQNTYQLEPEVIEYETVSVRPQIKTPSRFTPRPTTAETPSPPTTPTAPLSRRTQAQVQPQRTSSTLAPAAPSPDPDFKSTSTSITPSPPIISKTPRSLNNQAEVEPRIITHSQNPSRVSQNQKITLSATLSIQGANSTRKTLPLGSEIVTVDSFITEEGKLARRRVTIKKPIITSTTPLPLPSSKTRGRLTYQESLSKEDYSSYGDSSSYEDYNSKEELGSTEKPFVIRSRDKENNNVVDNESSTLRSRYIRPVFADVEDFDDDTKDTLRRHPGFEGISGNNRGVPIRTTRLRLTSDYSEEDNSRKSTSLTSKEPVHIKLNSQSFSRSSGENESNKSRKNNNFSKQENYSNSQKSSQINSGETPSIEKTSSEIDDSEIENKSIFSKNQDQNSFIKSSQEIKENIRLTEYNQPKSSEKEKERKALEVKPSNQRTSQESVQSELYQPKQLDDNNNNNNNNNKYNIRSKLVNERLDSRFNNPVSSQPSQEFFQPRLIEQNSDTTRFPSRSNVVTESPKTYRNSNVRIESIRQQPSTTTTSTTTTTQNPHKLFYIRVEDEQPPENDVIQKYDNRPRESYIPQTLPSGTTPTPFAPSQPTPLHNATSGNNDRDCNNDRQCRDKSKIRQPVTNSRNRGSASYTTSSDLDGPLPSQQTVNRGTPASVRSRPTLKPSTAIVSNAKDYIDIYRYPPYRPEPVYPTPTPDKTAAKCRKDVCLLPDCYCGGKDIPGDYTPEEIPQMVLLTFDDSVNDLNKGLYSDLFEKGRRNPNGCPIAATFYVSHEWTDYSQVQNLYADGHEMASHSVSHSFGEQFSQKKWNREIGGQREILSAYGGVKLEDIRGMRAPFLAVGGNKMFKMLYDSNFTYDSSMPVYENRPPSWPYTLDYKLFHDCMIPPCPTKSYPGVWEVPMVMWQDLNGGRCSMGDACSNPPTADGVYKMLVKNFERHYTTNRAPFGLFYHAAWFTQPHHKEGFIAFLDTIVGMKDVWLVTNWQALQWVRDPTPNDRLGNFQPFQCNYPDRPKRCNNPKVCNLWHKSGVRYMRTCQPCPDIYPWTGKTGIRNSRVDNEIEE